MIKGGLLKSPRKQHKTSSGASTVSARRSPCLTSNVDTLQFALQSNNRNAAIDCFVEARFFARVPHSRLCQFLT